MDSHFDSISNANSLFFLFDCFLILVWLPIDRDLLFDSYFFLLHLGKRLIIFIKEVHKLFTVFVSFSQFSVLFSLKVLPNL